MVRETSCKNVCYGYLFQIEDKKHNNDRIIYTLKSLLKRWPKLQLRELEKFDFMKKDTDLQEILD